MEKGVTVCIANNIGKVWFWSSNIEKSEERFYEYP